jgi:hypothetical protein
MFADFNEFMSAVIATFPQASVEEDNEGQLIVYTNLTLSGDDSCPVVTMGD